jgi:hypothetical protein
MTTDSMTLIQAVQQVGNDDLLRQLAEVALAKLMAFEVESLVGATKGKPHRSGPPAAMVTATGLCIPAWGRWNYASPSCAKGRISPRSWNPAD